MADQQPTNARIELLQSEMLAAYDQYLLGRDDSILYYSSQYMRLLESLLNCEPHYLIALDGADIRGVLPLMILKTSQGKVYNSLPYYGSNGGILADTPGAQKALLDSYSIIAADSSTVSTTIIHNPFAQQDTEGIPHNYTDYRIAQFTQKAP